MKKSRGVRPSKTTPAHLPLPSSPLPSSPLEEFYSIGHPTDEKFDIFTHSGQKKVRSLLPLRRAFSTTMPSFSRSACFTATSSSSRWIDWAIRKRFDSRCFMALRILDCSRRFVLSSGVSVFRLGCKKQTNKQRSKYNVIDFFLPTRMCNLELLMLCSRLLSYAARWNYEKHERSSVRFARGIAESTYFMNAQLTIQEQP